jgi:hypothetical protein
MKHLRLIALGVLAPLLTAQITQTPSICIKCEPAFRFPVAPIYNSAHWRCVSMKRLGGWPVRQSQDSRVHCRRTRRDVLGTYSGAVQLATLGWLELRDGDLPQPVPLDGGARHNDSRTCGRMGGRRGYHFSTACLFITRSPSRPPGRTVWIPVSRNHW